MAAVEFKEGSVPKLGQKNYIIWAAKMECFLKAKELWEIVNNPPQGVLGALDQKAHDKAMAYIVLSLQDEQYLNVAGLKSVHEVWQRLKEIHVNVSACNIVQLSRKLFRANLKPGDSMEQHLQYIQSLFIELEQRGVKFPEAQRTLLLLNSLDSSWGTVSSIFECKEEKDLNFESLKACLLNEAEKRSTKGNHETRYQSRGPREQAGGFHGNEVCRGRFHPQEARACNRDRVTALQRFCKQEKSSSKACYICGQTTHLQKHCLQKRGLQDKKQYAQEGQLNIATVCSNAKKDKWLIDSGASQTIINDSKLFYRYTPIVPEGEVALANGQKAKITGSGSVQIPYLESRFNNVLCVPEMEHNLLSVSNLDKQGYETTFVNGKCLIKKNGNVYAQGIQEDNLYVLKGQKVQCSQFKNVSEHDSCIHLLHRRLGHTSFKVLGQMQQFAEGMAIKGCKTYLDCAVCKVSKSKAFPVSKCSTRITTKALELVHADLIGPMQASLGGAKYALVIVDDYSRFGFCYLLKSKTEVLQQFKQWLNFVERKYKQQVCQLQTDRGTEFMSSSFQQWIRQLGIKHRRTNPHSAPENGVAERRNGVLQTMKDSLLEDSGMSKAYWGEAILTANYIVNRLWSSSINNTPYAMLYGRKPSLAHLRTFGSTAWVHIPKAVRRKGQQKARKLKFIGYEPGSKGYRFTDGSRRVVISRSASFAEQNWNKIDANYGNVSLSDGDPLSDGDLFNDNNSVKDGGSVIEGVNVQGGESEQDMKPQRYETQEQTMPRRSERWNKGIPPDRYSASKIKVCNVWYEPRNYKEVLALPKIEQDKWKEAMDKEMKSMGDHEVFTSVTLPQGNKAVGCKWVYKKKVLPNNEIQYKARLVAQGFSQLKNVHYDEVFAPTVKSESIRLALTLAAAHKYKIWHFDINTAFLNANLEEEIYMIQAPGYESVKPNMVYKLNKAIYGLKQSARNWNICLDNALKGLGFKGCKADGCVYTGQVQGRDCLLLAFVDDICLIAQDTSQVKAFANKLEKKFELKNLGEIKHYLGVEIQRTEEGNYILSQKRKIEQLLEKYKMEDCNTAPTPMSTEFYSSLNEDKSEGCDQEVYHSAIGSLLYLSQWSRPDIACAVSILSRFTATPTKFHWMGVKRVLRYLKGTVNLGLKIKVTEELKLKCYVDSDFANDVKSRKSNSGIMVMFGGVLIGWKSRKQTTVAVSTAEAEFIALSELCSEIVWYVQLLKDLNVKVNHAVIVNEDNAACIRMATGDRVKNRSKHVDIKYCNVREAVKEKLINLQHCCSEENLADMMTKPLGGVKHVTCIKLIGMIDSTSHEGRSVRIFSCLEEPIKDY